MFAGNFSGRGVGFLIQSNLGESVADYRFSVGGVYLIPFAFVCFVAFLFFLGFFARSWYSLHRMRVQLSAYERELGEMQDEIAKASERLAEEKQKLSERERKVVESALDEIDRHVTDRKFDEPAKRRLWDMAKSRFGKQ